jgi:hypothetical protein
MPEATRLSRMNVPSAAPALIRAGLLLALMLLAPLARADVLLGKNGERFVGTVVEETADAVVFHSELGGRLTIPRARLREIQRTGVAASFVPLPPPPDARLDWIELKSGEWLAGRIKSMQHEKLEFDSEEMDLHTFDWDDIRTLRSPQLFSVGFDDKRTQDGSVLVESNLVQVISSGTTNVRPRGAVLAITPTGARELSKWSGQLSAGMSVRSGNTKEVEYNAHATVERRTPLTRMTLDYLGNFSSVNDAQTENNQRGQGRFDYFLSRRLFMRVPDIESYHDPLQNINHRVTIGGGVGYDLVKNRRVEWNITAGPAWQRTWYHSVPEGESDTKDSLAAVLGSRLDIEVTRRIDLLLEYRGQLTGRESGESLHHGLARLEFEIHKRLKLDLTFTWDRISHPKTEAGGDTPSTDDLRLTTGLGIDF